DEGWLDGEAPFAGDLPGPLADVCAAAWPGFSPDGPSAVPSWDGADGGAAGALSPPAWPEPGPDVFTGPDVSAADG
ncbi:hypothetical protein, partial [Nonomuraea terrae]|uniref:hypothetical protein n=1 Tax=Nonomuraea terrae TaxID=2530383 RepID=UPI001CB74D69